MVSYCPRRGDIVWLTFDPQAGHEQAGHRPALVLSPEAYNQKRGWRYFVPSQAEKKGTPLRYVSPRALRYPASSYPIMSKIWIGKLDGRGSVATYLELFYRM